MRSLLCGLLALAFTQTCHAQAYAPALMRPLGHAPDLNSCGYYWVNSYGQVMGPYYYVRPSFGPETGVVGSFVIPQKVQAKHQQTQMQMQNQFPTHPYMRSPRDFFMHREMLEENRLRDVRPYQVP